MALSTKERIKEHLFREALCTGRIRPCDCCNEYCLKEELATERTAGDKLCPRCAERA